MVSHLVRSSRSLFLFRFGLRFCLLQLSQKSLTGFGIINTGYMTGFFKIGMHTKTHHHIGSQAFHFRKRPSPSPLNPIAHPAAPAPARPQK